MNQLKCRVCNLLQDSSEFLLPNGPLDRNVRLFCAACRRAQRRKHPPASRKLRNQLFEIAEGRCCYCDAPLAPGWHVDHVIPRHLNGIHDISNMVAACATCNAGHLAFIQQHLAVLRMRGLPRHNHHYEERVLHLLRELRITTGATFWERRTFVQAFIRRNPQWCPEEVPEVPASTRNVLLRTAHLIAEARGNPPEEPSGTA